MSPTPARDTVLGIGDTEVNLTDETEVQSLLGEKNKLVLDKRDLTEHSATELKGRLSSLGPLMKDTFHSTQRDGGNGVTDEKIMEKSI